MPGGNRVVAPRLDTNVVRWVGVDQMYGRASQQAIHVAGLAGIPAQQPVLA